jgi:predicted lipoprotein with Yx(FWY)xxD motif
MSLDGQTLGLALRRYGAVKCRLNEEPDSPHTAPDAKTFYGFQKGQAGGSDCGDNCGQRACDSQD